ncbi:MAG TPA: Tim44/TimA family putative adaptor protein [Aestuariivirga sp.]|nr:Tim44/TimA family putative adaptor protein [Aestuariivirga sp.]
MSTLFDPFNLLLLGIALLVFWRLRSVLGSRTGNERPPFDPYAARKSETPLAPEKASGTVLRFPKGEGAEPSLGAAEPPLPVWMGYAPEGTPLAIALAQLAEADPNFTPKSFVEGAKLAYEMIVEAFAKADKAALKDLLSKEVFDGFVAAMDARAAAGQTVDTRFVGIDKAELKAIELVGKRASITIKFVSEIISVTRAKDGAIVEGDPKEIREITDVWTFERDIASRDPNWKLSATQAGA